MEQISQVSLRRSRRGGFTLIELLVVIGIIGMLVALLLPAVMSAQEQARQVQCAKQMKDLAGAHLMHAMKKGRFAGWKSKSGDPWVVQIMPYLDMQQRSRSWKNGTSNTAASQLAEYGPIEILFCPSNPPENPGESSQTGYAVNAGGEDGSDREPNDPAGSNKWTALFHDRYVDPADADPPPVVSIGLDDVLDGKRQTLLLSENASLAADWDTDGETNQGIIFEDSGNTLNNPAGTDDAEGRPSSFHQEGFNAAYCDGSVDFYFVDQDDADETSRKYHNMMTPAGAYNGIDPGSTP